MKVQRSSPFKQWHPFIGPFDPCPPIRVKWYSTPPQLYLGFQPPGLEQFSPREALARGTLWPALFSPYGGKADDNTPPAGKEG